MDKRKTRADGKNVWILLGVLAVAVGVAVITFGAVRQVLAAPEDPAVEAKAARMEPAGAPDPAVAGGQEKAADQDGMGSQQESREIDGQTQGTQQAASLETEDTEAAQEPDTPLIALDPGHGGLDEGCSFQGVLEKDVNLKIALLVKKELEDLGYRVLLMREDDSYVAKEARVESANSRQADAYISIHQNSCETADVKGIETWYDGTDTARDSRRLARLVHQQTLKKTDAAERDLRNDAAFCVTGQTAMPACLIETGFLSHKEEREKLTTEEYQEQVAAGIAEGIDLYFHPRTMYLTFDDGPTAENTVAVLDILKEKNIQATFFVVGENVRRNPDVARRIVEEGHTIGIHCDSHDYEKIYESADSYLADFDAAYQTVLEATGVEARLFRFPGGSINAYNKAVREEIVEKMTGKGFVYFDWNASLEDAVKNTTGEQLIENAKSSTLGRRKVVLLAHDVICHTVCCLEELLDAFPEYEMKPLTPGVDPIQFREKEE